ncbi:flocculation protein FLO11-like [Selaginella moellendorffii]|uniref:flocculation protein FLO11-like n=1 Tax=Selaginella moellendorffii TaxID=88036 RepID=UPI000D1CB756|nr:flocculation protein FLO11-like [Selaginella moellendorffii]|eukprot:XP_024529644.1 flocculation protein FLO11-like [Selaginella moellendorffii]
MVKVKNLLGPDAVEGLQKLPPSRPDSALSEAEKTTREVTEDPNKKPRKSRSPEAMREGGEGAASKPPIRIQSKVYPRKSPSPKLGKGDDDRRSPSPLSASGSQTPDSRSTTRSETASQGKNLIQIIQDDKTKIIESRDDGSDKRVRRPARKDKAVQTDSITVSSLAKAAEKPEKPPTPVPTPKPTVADKVSARPETPTTTPTSSPATPATGSPSESPALDGDSSKVNMLHKELEKSKKQLNYYRTRNWAEKHEAHAVPIPVTATRRPEEPLAPEGDVGLIFVYNPTSGFHTMLSSGDVGQSKNKGSLIRGSTIYHHDKPMSAPAGLSRSGMPMSVSTSNRVVSASQVMKLIAKRREQQQAAKK